MSILLKALIVLFIICVLTWIYFMACLLWELLDYWWWERQNKKHDKLVERYRNRHHG